MNRGHKITAGVLLAGVVLCLVGSFMTRGVMEHLPFLHGQGKGWNAVPRPTGIVDQRPWTTAKTLAALAVSAEELELAREAERLADHEVDQAFAQSLRQATAETRHLTGEALVLQQRVNSLQQMVKEDQERVTGLTPKSAPTAGAAAGSSTAPSPAGDDLDVAKAQLGLDQDELTDSMEDLARASGDHRGKIQQELSAREASMKKYDEQGKTSEGKAGGSVAGGAKTLAGQITEWWAQRNRLQLIQQAEQLARADVAALTADHPALEPEAQAAEAKGAARKAAGESTSTRVKELESLAAQRNILSIRDDRLGAQHQLVALYVRWG